MSIRNILTAFIVPLSILLPIVILAFKYKTASKAFKVLFYYLLTAGTINAIAIVLSSKGIRNLFLLHIFTILELVFFLVYFYIVFKDRKIRDTLKVLAVVLPLLFLFNFLFIQGFSQFNTYTRPLEAIVITVTSLVLMYKSGFVEDWLALPSSWINIGILVYFPAATVIFILSNYFVFVASNRTLNHLIWDIHSILVLGMYLCFAKGFTLIKNSDGR
jgi:hypothetical protein